MVLARIALRRLLISIPVLFVSSILVFTMVANSADPLERLRLNPGTPPEVIVRRAHDLHLDKPVVERYQIWFTHFVRGDFGQTIDGLPVRPILIRHLLVTARMVLLAMLAAIVVAVAVGVISAVRQYSTIDYASTFAGLLLLAMPIFWFAELLKLMAVRVNNWIGHRFVYTTGDVTPGLHGGVLHNLGNYAGHLILPTVALAGIYAASWSRFQRASMLEVLNTDYVRVARAKGLSRGRVLVRHALRNALIPLATVVSIDFAGVLGGAIITEKVFSWQGMGQLLISGVQDADINKVLAWLMVSATIVVLFNLVTDVIYGVLDPRIQV